MGKNLPLGVFIKDGRYYFVRASGKRRLWVKLTRVKEGLAAMYMALAKLHEDAKAGDLMPKLIADWQMEVMPAHAPKTQKDDRSRCRNLAESFAEARASQVTSHDINELLKPLRDRPRTHNEYRALIRDLMRLAIIKGYRNDNPVTDIIKEMPTPARTRYITDSELRRIKVGCLYGRGGRETRTGVMMACLIEVAYLTGGDVSVLIRLLEKRDPMHPDEPHVSATGVFLRRDKTGKAVVITWTPRLVAVIARLKKLKAERLLKKRAEQRVVTPCLFTKQDGQPMTYGAVREAWDDAIERSGVLPAMFRDIRAKALTDKEERDGMIEAQAMGTHSTQTQTADYVRQRKARNTKATR